jgi:ABC-type uncharacterized transport system ATPase subunit
MTTQLTNEQAADSLIDLLQDVACGTSTVTLSHRLLDALRMAEAALRAQGEPVACAVYVGDELMKAFHTVVQATDWARRERHGGSTYVYHIRSLYLHPQGDNNES